MKKLVIILLLLTSINFAQENSGKVFPYTYTPNFFLDMINKKGDIPGQTAVDIYVQVPYSNLQFVKTDDVYLAEYSCTVTFYDEDEDEIVFESTWPEEVSAKNYNQTDSKDNLNISRKNFNLMPGKYILRSEVYDKDSKKKYSIKSPIKVMDYSDKVGISDILLIKDKIETEQGISFVPNISRYITSSQKKLPIYFEIYADTSKNVFVDYVVTDSENELVSKKTDTMEINSGINRVTQEVDEPALNLGQYQISVTVKDMEKERLTGVGKKFYSRIVGFPRTITDLDKAIKQMIYIASSDIVDKILEIDDFKEKQQQFINYWKAKDPSPNTLENEILVEYYRRVEYANKNFKNYREGWRSDMGMIYITLGPPDNIDRHPFDSNSKPYEIWQYYDINRRFVFVDETGFGEYRLINTNYRDWSRYRN